MRVWLHTAIPFVVLGVLVGIVGTLILLPSTVRATLLATAGLVVIVFTQYRAIVDDRSY